MEVMVVSSCDVEVVFTIDVFHGFQPCLWQCSVVEEITYPVIHSSVHGQHDGANLESVQHSIRKLHPLL